MSNSLKKATRARMAETGENYTTARRKPLEALGRFEESGGSPDPDDAIQRTGSLSAYKRHVDEKSRKGGA